MIRFLYFMPVAAILSVWAFIQHHLVFGWVVIFVLLVVMGFGVAIPQMRLFGNFICGGNKSKKQVALTFDDGPDPRSTPQLLELLRAGKIHAAFFCIGKNVATNTELSARMVREGHLLQNHSYAHSPFTNFFSVARLQAELLQTQTAIQAATGIVPQFYRPPMGLSNPRTFRAAQSLDLKVVGWTIRSLDTIYTDPGKIVARISKQLQPGAIILLHDGNIAAARLIPTMKLLLATLRERGYDVVRLDKLLE